MAGIALAASCVTTQAQVATNIFFGPTGTEASLSNPDGTWAEGYGNGNILFDTTNPPPTGDTAGSILTYITLDNTGTNASQNYVGVWDNNNNWYGASGNNTIDGTKYASIEMDFKYDTNSTINSTNPVTPSTAPYLTVGLDKGYGDVDITTIHYNTIDPSNSTPYFDGNWHHWSVPIPVLGGISAVAGPAYHAYWGPGTVGTMNYWLANVEMVAKLTTNPPPSCSLYPVVPGLVQFADTQPSYNRQDIATTTNGSANLTWYGHTPVTYSWKIASWPTGAAGWTASLNLTPDPQASQTYSDPDWTASNDLWISISANADGTVSAGIAYKTNQPGGNGQLFSPPTQIVPGSEANGLTVPSAVGTWTLTFANNTDMTLTAPNGSSTNASLPADVAAGYNGYVGAFLNSSPANNANVGDYMIYSAFNITGVGTPVNENLTSGALSAPFLQLLSQNYPANGGGFVTNPPNQVFVTSAADAYWFVWTIPYTGFGPIVSTNLGGAWSDLVPATQLVSGTKVWNLLSKSSLKTQFYAMIERTFSQLQVLWPGQTNAPGTPSGYVGSPEPESVNTGYNGLGYTPVTVNAVDSTFHIVALNAPDTAYLTNSPSGSDPIAILGSPVTFTNGTAVVLMTWGTTGSWTISAGDTVNTNIPVATSTTVTVGP